jgi:hypothetical protein
MRHEIYIDESCQNGHKFMVLGGVVIEQPNMNAITRSLTEIREQRGLDREIKWGKISGAKLECYKSYLDVFFDYMNNGQITFHSVLIDCSQLNHSKYNDGNHEIGFSKFTYQLLLRIGKECRTYESIHAYLDNRNSNQSLDELRSILNSGIAKRHQLTHKPFKRVQYVDSKNCDFVQLVDLFIGAIGYQSNGKDLVNGASQHRIALIQYISSKAKLRRLDEGTAYGKQGFTIWKMRLGPR